MNGNETGTVEYSTELAFNSKLPNLIVLNAAFYMHLIRQFDSAHVKCDRRLNQALVMSCGVSFLATQRVYLTSCKKQRMGRDNKSVK